MGEIGDFISPEYRAMQRELHEREETYGISSRMHVEAVRQNIERTGSKSVLDYGCGRGALREALGDIVREYDPAVPGKDALPDRADMVVCTDVLEHIEPERLDAVLEHIRNLAIKAVMFVIATRPAQKTLSDGRNAHLIIESAAWWREKLSVRFEIERVIENEKGIGIAGKPYLTIGDINAVGVMSDNARFDQVLENIRVTDRRITVAEPHNRVAILMCYGPSINDTWRGALEEQRFIGDADIVSVSGAHDWLIEHGIAPRFHIECDPRQHKGDMLTKPQADTEYLMATCCHPAVVGKLRDFNLTLWHLDNGTQSYKIGKIEKNAIMVGGGGSVGLRAISVLYVLGYRRYIIHGMDCSYRDEGEQTHAGRHTGKKTQKITVACGGRKFISAPVLLTYMRDFDALRTPGGILGDPDTDPTKIEIVLRGDGLLQHALKTCGAIETVETSHQPTAA